jgi:hypothetical protein
MSRPAVEVAEILHAQGDTVLAQHPWLGAQQRAVLRAIARCRTAALGGHVDRCDACGHQAISYNSCRNRHGPKCQAQARERWLHARERELLDVPYVHVVFTLPHGLLPLAYRNSARLYAWLFQASAATLREVAADPRHLGAEIGVLSILHTWGQTLVRHPHVHCVAPAGGLSPDHQRWIHPPYAGFFLPVTVLSRVFRCALRDRCLGALLVTNSLGINTAPLTQSRGGVQFTVKRLPEGHVPNVAHDPGRESAVGRELDSDCVFDVVRRVPTSEDIPATVENERLDGVQGLEGINGSLPGSF